MIANLTLPYSTLNPDTSSDSPSAKSKGVRLVSAKAEIKIITINGKNNNTLKIKKLRFDKIIIFILIIRLKKNKRLSANIISYETVCAIPRIPPISAYFLFEAHPLIIKG